MIVGANASGKSNLRDAFRFLHGIGRGYTLADIIGGKYGAGGQVEWQPIRGKPNEIARFDQFDQPFFFLRVIMRLDIRTVAYDISVGYDDAEPEDFRNDQYLLRPLFRRLFRSLNIRADIEVCSDPLLGGVREALKSECLREIVDDYEGMIDLFILCVDRDGERTRRDRLDQIEAEFGSERRRFLAENAWEELETWTLAGLKLPAGWRWSEIRAEVSVKERYFAVLARQRGVADGPGKGRMRLGEEAAHNVRAIRQKCRKDFDHLAQRIQTPSRTPT